MTKVVTLKYDPTWKPLEWAKIYCKSYITNRLSTKSSDSNQPKLIDYFFADERDATMFILRWAE